MLDYMSMREKLKVDGPDESVKLEGKKILFNAYEKWCKIYKHSRKKDDPQLMFQYPVSNHKKKNLMFQWE